MANIGRMIEDMENDLRINLGEIYIKKTKEVVNSIRSYGVAPASLHGSGFHGAALSAAVNRHGQQRVVDSESV